MKERNTSRVNSQQLTVNSSIFYGFPMFQWFPHVLIVPPCFNGSHVFKGSPFQCFPTKALEFFTLRSSFFTSFNPSVQNLPLEYPPQSPDCR